MSPDAEPARPAPSGAAGAAPSLVLDRDNPWPGLASYDETAQLYFNGRSAEIEELARRVLDEPLTVLFGRSGLGKSSLLKAGLFPILRERGLVPVYIRLHVHATAAPLCTQVRAFLEEELRSKEIDYPEWPQDETLWQYLHRAGLEFWTTSNRLVQPVLVFDQFEEVFTLGRQLPAEMERFRTDLADLIENRVPTALRPQLEAQGAKGLGLDLQAMPYKLVLSLREDFLADLESWRASIPSLRRNRMRLLPMRAANAQQAIHNKHTAHLVDEKQAREMVAFLAARTAVDIDSRPAAATEPKPSEVSDDSEIDPALLSLFCAGVNKRRLEAGAAHFNEALIGAAKRTVVADFYRDCIRDQSAATRAFIEDELVTENGFRNSYSVDDAIAHAYVTEPQLDLLVNRRLLRRSHLLGTDRIELTHDLLTKAVVHERGIRLKAEREAQRQRDRYRVRLYVGSALVAAGVAVAVALYFVGLRTEANTQRQLAQSRQLAAMAAKEIGRDHELATWFALLAVSFGETAEAREALIDTALYSWPYSRITGADVLGGKPIAIAISNDGKRLAILATAEPAAALTLWNIEQPEPKRLWLQTIALKDADRLAFGRGAKRLAVGGASAIELLDLNDGACLRRLTAPEEVVAMAFARDGRFAWSDATAVHVVDLETGESSNGAGGCAESTNASPRLAEEKVDIKEVREISFGSKGELLLLALVEDKADQFALFRHKRDASGRWINERLTAECEGERSMSLGSNRFSITVSPAACGFALDGKSGGVEDDPLFTRRPRAKRETGISDVKWSTVGVSNIKVIGAGELEVSGPRVGNRWIAHLKGVDFQSAETLTEVLAISANGLRMVALASDGKTVAVYNLEPRPFLAELAKDSFAVAPDASWLALKQQRAFDRADSAVDIFERQQDAYTRARTITVPSDPTAIVATGDALIISRPNARDVEGDLDTLTERREIAHPESVTWSVPATLLRTAGARGEWAILTRPQSTPSGSVPSFFAVRAKDGGGEVKLGVGAPPLVASNGRFIAARPDSSEQGPQIEVEVLRLDGDKVTPIGKAPRVARSAWPHMRLADDGMSLISARGKSFPLTTDEAARRPATAATGTPTAGSATKRDESSAAGAAQPPLVTDSCEVRFTPRDFGATDKAYFDVVITAQKPEPRMPKQRKVERVHVAHTEKWLAMWDNEQVDVVDLKTCRDFGHFQIATVESISFEGAGAILRLDKEQHSVLLPLEHAITVGVAKSLLNRKYTNAERCRYVGIDCDKPDAAAATGVERTAAR